MDMDLGLQAHLGPRASWRLEIKAGVGGDESALFAGDLLRMYQRYAERQGWKTEIIDATDSEMGGYKDVSMAIKSRGTGEPGKTRGT